MKIMDLIKEVPLGKDFSSQIPEKAEERPSSPHDCAICLEQLSDKSFTNSCLHMFCFHCLLAWSKVKPECPLCKQGFCSIIHNIRSITDFDEYHVPPPEARLSVIVNPETQSSIYSREQDFFSDRRSFFSYRTTITSGAYSLPRGRSSSLVIRPYMDNLEIQAEFSRLNSSRIPYARHNRRDIYIEELETLPPPANGRYRESSPEFYRENEVQVHRLVRWLVRELMELSQIGLRFNHHELLHIILDMLPVYSINSTTFYSTVNGFLGVYTMRFIREFRQFATSPYEMEQYDRECVYISQRHGSQLSFIVTVGRDDTEEVQVIPNANNRLMGPWIDVNDLGASHLPPPIAAHSFSPLHPRIALHSAANSTRANDGISPLQPIIHISDSENDDCVLIEEVRTVPETIDLGDSDMEHINSETVNNKVAHHSPENSKIPPEKGSSSVISTDSQFDENCDKVILKRSKRKHSRRYYHFKSLEKHQEPHQIDLFDSFRSVTSSSEDDQIDKNDSDWVARCYKRKKKTKMSAAGRPCNKKRKYNVDESKSKKKKFNDDKIANQIGKKISTGKSEPSHGAIRLIGPRLRSVVRRVDNKHNGEPLYLKELDDNSPSTSSGLCSCRVQKSASITFPRTMYSSDSD